MTDLAIVREALATRMPVLGICRGHQLINIARGGSLHQDLSEIGHRDDHSGGTHAIGTASGTLSRRILGARAAVPTLHHQAIDRLGRGLTVTSTASDGLIESVEDPRLPFAVGVQWHAELPEATDAGRRLRDGLVEAARAHAGHRPAGRLSARLARVSEGLTHLDADGRARMVDVGAKAVTDRRAVARALVRMAPATAAAVRDGNAPRAT